MKKQCFVWSIVLSVCLLAQGQHGTPGDVKKMQGKWTPTTLYLGQAGLLPEGVLADFSVIFEGGKMTLNLGPEAAGEPVAFAVDASKTPKALDLVESDGPLAGMASLGIYELDGDTLKICIGFDAEGRPKDFSIPEGKTERFVMILRRAK